MLIRRRWALPETNTYAQTARLAVLHACSVAPPRLLRKRDSTLPAAKVLVLSRLLHKSLAQTAGDAAPFVEGLRVRLGSLRRRLLDRVDSQMAKADGAGLVEAMCAFSLATSSGPRDVLRHFLHVRREAVLLRVGTAEGGGCECGG